MYNFFYGFLRYSLFRFIRSIFRPKNMLILAIILFCGFLFFNSQVQAVWTGDDTYSDPNTTINLQYNSIVNDFIFRVENFKNANQYNNLIDYIKRSDLGYYIYYGSFDGSDMINGMTYTQDTMYIIFYMLDNPSLSVTQYESYCGIDCNIRRNNNIYVYFELSDNLYFTDYTSSYVYMPSALYNYRSDVLTNYLLNLDNNSQEILQDILTEQQEQTNTINQQYDYITQEPDSNDFQVSDLPQQDEEIPTDTTLEGINNIFTKFYNAMTKNPSSDDNITIPVPFTDKSFDIPYNYTSTYCPSTLKSIINTFWYFVASIYIIKDLMMKFQKLKTGDIENMQNDNVKGDIL